MGRGPRRRARLSSVGAVVGATYPRAVAEARRLMPQAVLLLPGIGAQGATPADVARRVHERASERARACVALGDLRVSRRRRRLAQGGSRRGGAPARRGLGGVRVVTRPEIPHVDLPDRRSAWRSSWRHHPRRPDREGPEQRLERRPRRPADHEHPGRCHDGDRRPRRGRRRSTRQGRRHARVDRRQVRHHGRRPARAEPGDRPARAQPRAEDPRRLTAFAVCTAARAIVMSGFPTGPHPHRARPVLAFLARQEQVPRRAAEREHARTDALAVRARPEEEPRRPQLEPSELAELDLEAPLASPDAAGELRRSIGGPS